MGGGRPGQPGAGHVAVGEPAADVVRIFVVEDRVGDKQVDATEPIDELDQTPQPDPGVLVDVDVEVPLDGGHGSGRAPVGVGGVDLRAAAGRGREPQVAWDG